MLLRPICSIVAEMTFAEERRTLAGHPPEEVADMLCELGVYGSWRQLQRRPGVGVTGRAPHEAGLPRTA